MLVLTTVPPKPHLAVEKSLAYSYVRSIKNYLQVDSVPMIPGLKFTLHFYVNNTVIFVLVRGKHYSKFI